MAQILKKASKYKRISTVLSEGEAHLRDPLTPPPQIIKVSTQQFVRGIIRICKASCSKKRQKA